MGLQLQRKQIGADFFKNRESAFALKEKIGKYLADIVGASMA